MNPTDYGYTEAIFNEIEYSKWDDMRDRMLEYAISQPQFLQIEENLEEEEFPQQFNMYPLGKGWDRTRKRMSPIQGPSNLFQIWSGDQLGDFAPPLTAQQINQNLSQLSSELICNITFVQFIGSGSFGDVYEVTADIRSSQVGEKYGECGKWEKGLRLACKMLRHKKPALGTTRLSPINIETSLNEMYALRYLRHKNICNIKEIVGLPEPNTRFPYYIIYYFLELCDGSFSQLIRQKHNETGDYSGYLPEHLNKPWVSQIASALEYLHTNGVVHLDIHSENILLLLDPSHPADGSYQDKFLYSTFKLTDFGKSQDFASTNDTFEVKKNSDVGKMLEMLFLSSIPKVFDPVLFFNFHSLCQGRKPTQFDPKEWLTVNPILKDIFTRYDFNDPNNSITAAQILEHEWLQSTKKRYVPIPLHRSDSSSTVDSSDEEWGPEDFYD